MHYKRSSGKLSPGADRRVRDWVRAASVTAMEGKASWIVGKSGCTCKCFSFGGKGILTSWVVRLYLHLWREVFWIAEVVGRKVSWLAGKSGYAWSWGVVDDGLTTGCSNPVPLQKESLYSWVLLHPTMQYLFLLLLCSLKWKSQQRYLFLLSSGHRGKPLQKYCNLLHWR